MEKHYDSIKGLISSKMIKQASETLGESEQKVSSAVSTILPALLGRLLNEGITPHIIGIVDDAGRDKLKSHLPEVFEGHGVLDGKNLGERMENTLIGSQNSEFPAAIASKYGIKAENADRLTNWVSATIAGYYGDRVVREKATMVTLLGELGNEKSELAADIPNDLYSKLGVSRIFGSSSPKSATKTTASKKEKKGNGWIWWLIIILLLLILLFFWWKSCDKQSKPTMVQEAEKTETVATIPSVASSEQNMIEMTLPDGEKISFMKGSHEEEVLNYLASGDYEKASADDLKSKWFEFNDVDFVFNSSNELTPGSMSHVNNLAMILKAYPDTKTEIGGFADKTGTKMVNMEISEARAKYIESALVSNGVDASRISTEGFGKEFATVPADASDAERAKDRDIAMRFVK